MRASWVGSIVITFHALTMSAAIHMYSNRLLHDILNPDRWLTPRVGVLILDICNIIGGVFSIWMVKFFGRKPLMVLGHIFVTLNFFAIGILINKKKDIAVFSLIGLYNFIYMVFTGSVCMMYSMEINCDVGFGMT